MDALEAVLRPVAKLLNRNIAESTPARELCARLAGTVIAVRVRDTALAAYFVIAEDALDVATASSEEPDVIISGSLITLARMIGESGHPKNRALLAKWQARRPKGQALFPSERIGAGFAHRRR